MNNAPRASSPKLIARAIAAGMIFGALSAASAGAATMTEVNGWLSTAVRVVRLPPSPGMHPDGQSEYVRVAGTDVAGSIDPGAARRGLLKNNQEVMIVPVDSGGTGAVFDALLFTRLGGRTQFAGIVSSPGGHLHVEISGGVMVVRRPVYKRNDPNCCPSGFHWERDTLNGLKLVKLKEYDTRRY